MSHKIIGGIISLLAAAILLAASWSLVTRANADVLAQTGSGDQEPRRERDGDPQAPDISFIDNPTAQCVRPEGYTDACYIQWNYLNVTASTSNYIISMTLSIDNRLRSYYSGFFQSSMYVPQGMFSPGFKVSCGLLGESGNPLLGKTHSYIIRAKETGGLKTANYGSVTCPADTIPVNKVTLAGPDEGYVGIHYDFIVTTKPLNTTLPIEYLWQVTGKSNRTITNGLTATQTYTWNSPGIKNATVQASNISGSATAHHSIEIKYHTVYLPISIRNH